MTDELHGMNVVVLGRFDPPTFSPAWLKLHDLIGAEEFAKSTVQVIIPPTSNFTVDWLQVTVTSDRLQLLTAMPPEFDRLRDIAVGIITTIPELPVSAIGINVDVHWQVSSQERYHSFGDTLLPKQFWGEQLKLPGMRDLTVEGVRDDGWGGYRRVTLQPSVPLKPYGIYALINDHFWLKKVDQYPSERSDWIKPEFQFEVPAPDPGLVPCVLEILGTCWESSRETSDQIVKSLRILSETDPK